jgi:predicted outer membrane repeat protein
MKRKILLIIIGIVLLSFCLSLLSTSDKWLPNEETLEREIKNDDDTVIVSGRIKDTLDLSVNEIDTSDYNMQIYDFANNDDLVFAYDISLYDNGSEWQPNSGDRVDVIMDADAIGINNGNWVKIIHEHNGKLKVLGVFPVTDYKLKFSTDGFSAFYGYVVDFEYNGIAHSLGGGKHISVESLLLSLGVNYNDDSIVSAEFSNPEYIYIGQMEGELGQYSWQLISLAPFDTEESLSLKFDDGAEMRIKVTDPSYGTTMTTNTTWDLVAGDQLTNCVVANGSTFTVNLHGDITVAGTILIHGGSKVVINGRGHKMQIVGNNLDMFYQDSTGTLELYDVTLDGGSNAGYSNNTFIHTYSYNSSKRLTISNSTLQNIRGNEGCALYLINVNANITNTNITNCASSGDGGPIFFHGNKGTVNGTTTANNSTLRMTNCTVSQCRNGSGFGGTIRTHGSAKASIYLTSCTFKNNYSTRGGGAILYNVATAGPNVGQNTCVIDGCLFENNTVGERGGAIQCESYMVIQNTTIRNNRAVNHGGGIVLLPYTLGDSVTTPMLSIGKGCIIEGNTASNGGGVAVLVKENVSGDTTKLYDVALDINLGDNGYIRNNNADETIQVVGTENPSGSDILKPSTQGCGGGIFIETMCNRYTTHLKLSSGLISGNSAKDGGGIYVLQTDVEFGQISIDGNIARGNGGGLYMTQTNTSDGVGLCTIANGSITNNTASGFGGGIYQTGSEGRTVISGSGKINNNTASNGGGIYIVNGGDLFVSGGIITGNKAIGTPTNVTTAKNSKAGVGGGVYIGIGTYTKKSTFIMEADVNSAVGLYGNEADFAAADAFAIGEYTSLTLPEVTGMALSGAGVAADGWFTDNCKDDSMWNKSLFGGKQNPGRYYYRLNSNLKIRVDAKQYLNKTSDYYCLTIGLQHDGWGQLIIKKQFDDNDTYQELYGKTTSIYKITSLDNPGEVYYRVIVFDEQDVIITDDGKVVVQTSCDLPDGNYTVEEINVVKYNGDIESITSGERVSVGKAEFSISSDVSEIIAIYHNNGSGANCFSDSGGFINTLNGSEQL